MNNGALMMAGQQCPSCAGLGALDSFGNPCSRGSIQSQGLCVTCNGQGMMTQPYDLCPPCTGLGGFDSFGNPCRRGQVSFTQNCVACQGRGVVYRTMMPVSMMGAPMMGYGMPGMPMGMTQTAVYVQQPGMMMAPTPGYGNYMGGGMNMMCCPHCRMSACQCNSGASFGFQLGFNLPQSNLFSQNHHHHHC